MKQAKQPMPRRHVPQRTCIACRRVGGKRDLVRIVRTANEGVRIDPTGKLNGRGAYLCRSRSCWEKALRSALLNRALKTTLQEDETAELAAFAASLPNTTEDLPRVTDPETTDQS